MYARSTNSFSACGWSIVPSFICGSAGGSSRARFIGCHGRGRVHPASSRGVLANRPKHQSSSPLLASCMRAPQPSSRAPLPPRAATPPGPAVLHPATRAPKSCCPPARPAHLVELELKARPALLELHALHPPRHLVRVVPERDIVALRGGRAGGGASGWKGGAGDAGARGSGQHMVTPGAVVLRRPCVPCHPAVQTAPSLPCRRQCCSPPGWQT